MLRQLLATKHPHAAHTEAEGLSLRRTLGPWGLTALGIGALRAVAGTLVEPGLRLVRAVAGHAIGGMRCRRMRSAAFLNLGVGYGPNGEGAR